MAVEGDGSGGDAADRDLALAAHIGQVGAEGEDEPKPDQGQRHGAIDRGTEGESRAEGAVEERSEEHTSELQSLMRISYAVFCLKKNNNKTAPPCNAKPTKNTSDTKH